MDGIRIIKKEKSEPDDQRDHFEKNFWSVDSIKTSEIDIDKNNSTLVESVSAHNSTKKFSWKDFWQEIKINIVNRRIAFSIIAVVLIISITSISVFSYNILKQNYDFIKLFNSGRYLIIFQNNTEMRATGGFIGSFATVEMKNGVFKNYTFDSNIYKRDHTFTENNSIMPPDDALSALIGGNKWAMRDSNWAVDFPSAAKQVAWFYEQEGGEAVDGVVAVNATVIQDILKVTGPIEMSEYNTTLTSDNFIEVTQYKVEQEYYADPVNRAINEPKSIIKDMVPLLIKKLSENGRYKYLTDIIHDELNKKQIMFYFYDDNKEKIAKEKGWAGDIKQTNGDYLHVNNSNIGGLKSSLKIKEDIKLNSSTSSDGSVVDTLTITRTHTGDGVWPDGVNNNYMRILVPYGSELISAKLDDVGCANDVQVKKESGKTVFSLWVNTAPRSSRILTLTYKLPIKLNESGYTLLAQKQSGNLGDNLEVLVDGKVKFNGILNTDKEIK